jgi:hypothetical protein
MVPDCIDHGHLSLFKTQITRHAVEGHPNCANHRDQKFRNKVWIFGFELNDPIKPTM